MYGAFQSRTLKYIASFCAELAARDGKVDKAIPWADVVKEVAVPPAAGFWRTCEIVLMLTESDKGAPPTFFETKSFDEWSAKHCGPPLMKSDRYSLMEQCGHEG